jgi:hypothetical protein
MKILTAALILASAALATGPAMALTCIRTQDIVSSNSKDGKTLVFTMKDGTRMVNHLQGVCSDLRFNGFVWTIQGPQEVCENQQSLRVLQSGQVCVLGKFDPPQKISKAPAP